MRYLSVLSKENTNTGTNLTDEEAIFLGTKTYLKGK